MFGRLLASLMLAASATSAVAAYPEKPISIVVPFTAAGPSDAVGRLLAKSFTDSLGQKVNVENIAGGGGSNGSARVAKAPGDGYTLLLHHFALAASAALYPKLPYDPAKDFEPIGLVS